MYNAIISPVEKSRSRVDVITGRKPTWRLLCVNNDYRYVISNPHAFMKPEKTINGKIIDSLYLRLFDIYMVVSIIISRILGIDRIIYIGQNQKYWRNSKRHLKAKY